ncbi:plastocyanin [Catalinimonas alkaloidigena]|uniref:T9SS type A sorting domain-containing protein n=1 Tax=Catalinimonas alkaloidigena TaxID=1075417 RepID=UPI002406AF74|nr:T9SS type A sorting domain-containing protein [Catalinimonas alkaloidigena]MDF9800030.1 plastocyanin [Catalinimonas alkaloidigena]
MKQVYKIFYSAIFMFILLNIPEDIKATHLIGGEISATATNCQSYAYEIEINLYERTGSDVEFGPGELYVGHGEPITFDYPGIEASTYQVDGQLYRKSTFSVSHTFPGPGEYTLYLKESNRNADVANMRNSVLTPFYIETLINIDALQGCNSSPQLVGPISPLAYAKSIYSMPLAPTDADGDSLSFELITPMQNIDENVSGYRLPHEFDLRFAPQPVSADGNTPRMYFDKDALVWDAPNLGGEFAVALRVNEWREVDGEWTKIGYVTRDFTLHVMDTLNNTQAQNYITSTREEISKSKVNIFPNPTPGEFTLEVNDDQWLGGTVGIYNILGQEIMQEAVVSGETQYDISAASQGVYFLTLQNGNLKKTIRFMKR